MPLFVLIGRDGPDGRALRRRHRDAHLANLQPLVDADRVRFAGPIRTEDGNPCGSVVVFEAADLAAARAFAETDPYAAEGVFASVEVRETFQVFPEKDS
jgi:uncharacterized protein YciI